MMRVVPIVVLGLAAGGFALVAGCGGADSSDLFGNAADGGGSSGASSSGATSSSSGASSSSSSGNSASSTSSGSTSSSSGGVDAGSSLPCKVGNPQPSCPANEYCFAAKCDASEGTCRAVPVVSGTKAPVCGCDGITYWNESVAVSFGAVIRATNECEPGQAVPCKNDACERGRSCNARIPAVAACLLPRKSVCWGLPQACPSVNGQFKPCSSSGPGNGGCRSECQAIRDQKTYYPDGTCPP